MLGAGRIGIDDRERQGDVLQQFFHALGLREGRKSKTSGPSSPNTPTVGLSMNPPSAPNFTEWPGAPMDDGREAAALLGRADGVLEGR